MSRPSATVGLSLGVDVIFINELDRLLNRNWFRHFLYSEGERREAATLTSSRRREFLAGRFAAKEAVLKVLRTGLLSGVPPRQIDIRRTDNGSPDVRLVDAAARRAATTGIEAITLSISHKGDLVIAVALGWPAGTLDQAETPSMEGIDQALDAAFSQTVTRTFSENASRTTPLPEMAVSGVG